MKGQTDDSHVFLRALSNLIGLTYILCWSLSFYPQPLLNWRRKSTRGLAVGFPILNVLGFTAYTISNAVFLYSPLIQRQYAVRHPTSPKTTVRVNDLIFAIHAWFMCVMTYSQFYPRLWGFESGVRQRADRVVLGVFWGSLFGVFLTILLILVRGRDHGEDPTFWAWIDAIYAVSYIKIVATFVKYCPQVMVNYRRKSTVGWSIWQILLDFAGGVLSILQLLIDASLQGETRAGIMGNPVKFLLGNVSILFDMVFMTQHYVLYRGARLTKPESASRDDEEEPLLNGHP